MRWIATPKSRLSLLFVAALAASLIAGLATNTVYVHNGFLHVHNGGWRWMWPVDAYLFSAIGAALVTLALLIAPFPRWLRPRGEWSRLAIVAAVLAVVFWLAFARGRRSPVIAWPLHLGLIAGAATVAWIALRAVRAPDLFTRIARGLQRLRGPALYASAGALAVAVGVASTVEIYHGHIFVIDSLSQVAQARLLLDSMWTLDVPQGLRDAFAFPFGHEGVPSYSQFPPGFIALLMLPLALDIPPHILNHLAAAATVILTAWLARRVSGGWIAARIAAVLILGSPFFLTMSGGVMNHPTTCVALLITAHCFWPGPRARSGAMPAWIYVLGGFTLGYAVATRPLTGLTHAALWGWMLAWPFVSDCVERLRAGAARPFGPRAGEHTRRMLAAAAGLAIPIAGFLFYNIKTTGSPLVMAYATVNPGMHMGFHEYGDYAFQPLDLYHHRLAGLFALNNMLWGWPVGSCVPLIAWWWHTRLKPDERILLAIFLAQSAAYALYWFFDTILGPRFLYETMPALAVLSALGLAPRLRGVGTRQGLAWLCLIAFSGAGLCWGFSYWKLRYGRRIQRLDEVRETIREHDAQTKPTALVMLQLDSDYAGAWFPPFDRDGNPGLVFVPLLREDLARGRPELADVQWVYHDLDTLTALGFVRIDEDGTTVALHEWFPILQREPTEPNAR